jgi:C4-dicarboxylate-specific signal transduction histidine kinase
VQLQQVVLNIFVNACDAMSGNDLGDRRLSVTSGIEGTTACIEISDNGHGIEDLDVIFEPFYSTKAHGIGLGLALCRKILAAQGGSLCAANNSSRGATFRIGLPLHDARAESHAATTGSAQPRHASAGDGKSA